MEYIIEKFIFLIPELDTFVGYIVHCCRNGEEMFKKFQRDIFINGILQGYCHHVQAKHTHPTCAITLLNISSRRQRCTAVKDTDIVKAEKSSLKDIFSLGVLTVDPPRKVKQ